MPTGSTGAAASGTPLATRGRPTGTTTGRATATTGWGSALLRVTSCSFTPLPLPNRPRRSRGRRPNVHQSNRPEIIHATARCRKGQRRSHGHAALPSCTTRTTPHRPTRGEGRRSRLEPREQSERGSRSEPIRKLGGAQERSALPTSPCAPFVFDGSPPKVVPAREASLGIPCTATRSPPSPVIDPDRRAIGTP